MRSSDAEPPRSPHKTVFRLEGAYWTIVYDAQVIRLPDEKGLRIWSLLRHPGRKIHVNRTDPVG